MNFGTATRSAEQVVSKISGATEPMRRQCCHNPIGFEERPVGCLNRQLV
jgi:hypothetical protein